MSLFGKAAVAAILTLSAPAAATWREASSTHFLIYSEDGAKQLREFAQKLERYDAAMRVMRDVPPVDPGKANRVTVYVVSSLDKVRRLGGVSQGSGVAGYYRGQAGRSLAVIPRSLGYSDMTAQVVLLHEYAHHFMAANFAGAWPRWFVEGFAEFNSTASFGSDGSVSLGKPPQFRAYNLVNSSPLPIEKLLQPDKFKDVRDGDIFYGRAWLLTHYLTLSKDREGQLGKYLTAINAGTPNVQAARDAFGDLDKLNANLNTYLRRSMLYYSIPAKLLTTGPIEVRELGPAEQAMMELRIRSRNGVDDKGAAEILPLARAAAASFANDPFAQTTLAEAEFDMGNLDETLAAANRALMTDPKSMEALLYRAKVLEARARKSSDGPAAWKAARAAYAAANRSDPDDPRPLRGYYESFRQAGITPPKLAIEGLLRAQMLAPQDDDLRMRAADQYVRDGKLAEARALLAPVAYDPHASEASKAALTMIEEIDAKLKKPTPAPSAGDGQNQ